MRGVDERRWSRSGRPVPVRCGPVNVRVDVVVDVSRYSNALTLCLLAHFSVSRLSSVSVLMLLAPSDRSMLQV
jgi:hypothetical protein